MDAAPASSPVPRRDDVRARNDAIAAAARSHRFDDAVAIPLICECDNEGCADFVRLNLADYESARAAGCYVVLPGHRLAAVPHEELPAPDYVLYRLA